MAEPEDGRLGEMENSGYQTDEYSLLKAYLNMGCAERHRKYSTSFDKQGRARKQLKVKISHIRRVAKVRNVSALQLIDLKYGTQPSGTVIDWTSIHEDAGLAPGDVQNLGNQEHDINALEVADAELGIERSITIMDRHDEPEIAQSSSGAVQNPLLNSEYALVKASIENTGAECHCWWPEMFDARGRARTKQLREKISHIKSLAKKQKIDALVLLKQEYGTEPPSSNTSSVTQTRWAKGNWDHATSRRHISRLSKLPVQPLEV